MWDYLAFSGLAMFALIGVALAALQLPGVWLILSISALFDWYHHWQSIGWKWLLVLFGLAVLSEIFDALAGFLAARRAGASRRAGFGAIIGGFAGMLMFTIPIPIPGLGAVIGGLIGCFFGALIAELTLHDKIEVGVRVGLFATVGKVIGLAAKTSAAAITAGTIISLAAWSTF